MKKIAGTVAVTVLLLVVAGSAQAAPVVDYGQISCRTNLDQQSFCSIVVKAKAKTVKVKMNGSVYKLSTRGKYNQYWFSPVIAREAVKVDKKGRVKLRVIVKADGKRQVKKIKPRLIIML
jgi:hypothetical protein